MNKFTMFFLLAVSVHSVRPVWSQLIYGALGASAVVAYYKKDEIITYAYGAYLKYWRLPYLKEDILECIQTGKKLSAYSKETIKIALKKSPDFLALYLKEKLTSEQAAKVVTLLRDILDPEQAQEFCTQFIDTTVSSVKDCVEGVVHKVTKSIYSFMGIN